MDKERKGNGREGKGREGLEAVGRNEVNVWKVMRGWLYGMRGRRRGRRRKCDEVIQNNTSECKKNKP